MVHVRSAKSGRTKGDCRRLRGLSGRWLGPPGLAGVTLRPGRSRAVLASTLTKRAYFRLRETTPTEKSTPDHVASSEVYHRLPTCLCRAWQPVRVEKGILVAEPNLGYALGAATRHFGLGFTLDGRSELTHSDQSAVLSRQRAGRVSLWARTAGTEERRKRGWFDGPPRRSRSPLVCAPLPGGYISLVVLVQMHPLSWGSMVGGKPEGRISPQPNMDTKPSATTEEGTSTVPPQPTAASEEGGFVPPPRSQRRRPCGAEIKRRKRARQAALAQAGAPVCSSTPQKAGAAAPQQRLAPRASLPSGGRPGQKPPRSMAKGAGRLDPKGKSQSQPSASKTEKRPRTDGSGSSQGLNPRKKACSAQDQKRSYKEAATSNLRVAIINRSSPLGRVTPEQSEMIKKLLNRRLDEILLAPVTSTAAVPTFGGLRVVGEILRITCDDELALNWLTQVVDTSEPLWDGAQLKVVQEDQIPKLWKVSIWIPGEAEEPRLAITRLSVQNPTLDVRSWCTFHSAATVVPPGRLLVMGVGEKDAHVLNSAKGKVKYRFTTLTAKVSKSDPVTEEATMEVEQPPTEEAPPQ